MRPAFAERAERWALPLALMLATTTASPASGQSDSPVSIRAFVDAVTNQVEDQAPRFHVPVCAASFGLPGDYGPVVVDRIRAIARNAGIPVDRGARCTPNLIVMVADDSHAVAQRLRRTRPDVFGGLSAIDIDRAIAGSGPARAWQYSEVVRAEGGETMQRQNQFLNEDVHLHHGVPASLLRTTTRRDLRLAVVLFSLDAINGLTLMQIADHAALRGLASTRPAPAATGRSILGLFDESSAASGRTASATRWDQAYLRALYRDAGASQGSVQRASLAHLIEQDLAEQSASAAPR